MSLTTCLVGVTLWAELQPAINGSGMRMTEWELYRMEHMRPSAHISRANPYNLDADVLKPHGKDIVELDRSFEGIRTYLETHVIEGIVFWKDGHPRYKIKRKTSRLPGR